MSGVGSPGPGERAAGFRGGGSLGIGVELGARFVQGVTRGVVAGLFFGLSLQRVRPSTLYVGCSLEERRAQE